MSFDPGFLNTIKDQHSHCFHQKNKMLKRLFHCCFLGTDFEFQRYTKQKIIGEGSFSIVVSAVDSMTGEQVVIKKAKTIQEKKLLFLEYTLLARLHHPNIIRPKEFSLDDMGYMVLPKYRRDMFDDMNERIEIDMRSFVKAMVHAVSHIHSLNIVHRDIKPENILVNKDYSQVVLSDFGMAVNLSFSTPTDYCGTPAYVAPDVHDAYHKKEPYSIDWKKCDVFSLGVTFYTIYEVKFLLGTRLQDEFFTPSQEELNTAIEYMDGREDLKDLLKKMICINPDERISIDEISQHPYLQ